MNRPPPIKPRPAQQVEKPVQPSSISFGVGTSAVGFLAYQVPLGFEVSSVPRIATGAEIQRGGRDGVSPLAIDDLSGGYLSTHAIMSWERDKNRVYFNEGIWGTWIGGVATMPYLLTTQATLNGIDASGFRAANKRVHAAMFEGDWVGFIDVQMYRSASTSSPVLELPATADNVTEKVTAVGVGDIAGTQVIMKAGAASDNISYTADVTGDTVSWTEAVALSDTPYINALAYIPIGPGIWAFVGRPSTALGKGVWHFKADATLPATPQPTVLLDTKDIPGSLATTTLAEEDPIGGGNAGQGDRGSQTVNNVSEGVWQNVANIVSDNGSDATYQIDHNNTEGSAGLTSFLYANFLLDALPRGAVITGVQVVVNCNESDANMNAFLSDCELIASGSTVGIPKTSGAELGTSDGDITIGSSTDNWGISDSLRGADFINMGVRIRFAFNVPSGAADAQFTVSVDHIGVTVTYRMPGTAPSVNLGGFSCGVLPNNQKRLPVVEPVADDLTAITVQRVLKFYDFSWDAEGDRAVVEVSYPQTNVNYVGLIHPFQGGLALAGGTNESIWNQVKLIGSDGNVRDLGFPGFHGTNALTITRMNSQGNFLIVDTAYTDGSEAQSWLFYKNAWYACGVQQDKSSAISTEPILWAESTPNLKLNYLYRFYPVSTSNLAGAREFLPNDLTLDPNVANTSETKQDGPLYVQLVRLDVGPVEANKAVVNLQCQSPRIDDKTAYGTLRVLVDTGGDVAISSAEIDQTFDATAECFTDRNLASSLSPGIAYRSLIIRLIGDHQTGSAETPNLLPVLFNTVQAWEHLETIPFVLAPKQPGGLLHIINRLKSLENTKVVQRLYGGGYDIPATLQRIAIKYRPGLGTEPPREDDIESAVVYFRRTPGATA